MKKLLFLLLIFIFIKTDSNALVVRVKDVARIQGVTENQLIGYGLVVGLSGTGDTKNVYSTVQSIANMLRNFGVTVNPDTINKIKNVAAVAVTAALPPFAKSGDKVDAIVSSIGDATSLEGGTLLLTPLVGIDSEVYATAQGPVSIGGFNIAGAARRTAVQKNHPAVGRVPAGVLIAKDVEVPLLREGSLSLILNKPDFNTALRLSVLINEKLGGNYSKAVDSSRVSIICPEDFKDNIVSLIALIERLFISPDKVAKVIINERTGTVVMGGDVRISEVAISHGNLSIRITEKTKVSQPQPLTRGATVVTKEDIIKAKEEKGKLIVIPEGNRIEDIVKSLNAIGVTPRDLISIIQAIYQAGALPAELEII